MVRQEASPRLEESEIDRVWSDFIAPQQRENKRDFEALLKDPNIRPEFQERAIDVLLTPDFDLLPFDVNVRYLDYNSFTVIGEADYQFTPEQARYAAKRIPQFMEQAWRIYRAKSENGRGQYDSNREASNAISSLRNLNYLIPHLMAEIPEEEAERLFESFSPLDNIGMSPGDSVYLQPLDKLFRNEGIEDSFKIRARKRALEEANKLMEELTRKGEDPHFLSGALVSILSYRTDSDDAEAYAQELTDEINFILDRNRKYQLLIETEGVYSELEDRETKHRLIRQQVFSNESYPWGNRMRIGGYISLDFARQLVIDFAEDTELVNELQSRINTYEEWSEKRRVEDEEGDQRRQREDQRVQQALQEMRVIPEIVSQEMST